MSENKAMALNVKYVIDLSKFKSLVVKDGKAILIADEVLDGKLVKSELSSHPDLRGHQTKGALIPTFGYKYLDVEADFDLLKPASESAS